MGYFLRLYSCCDYYSHFHAVCSDAVATYVSLLEGSALFLLKPHPGQPRMKGLSSTQALPDHGLALPLSWVT